MHTRFLVEPPSVSSNADAAVALANAIAEMPEFYARIRSKPDGFDARWTTPEATPSAIAQLLHDAQVRVTVRIRKARWKVLGWTNEGEPGIVYLNARRLDRSRTSIVATLIHEWVHCVDRVSAHDFHHGSNSPAGKQNSAPYWIDELAGEIASNLFERERLSAALAEAHGLQDGDELFEGLRLPDAAKLMDEQIA